MTEPQSDISTSSSTLSWSLDSDNAIFSDPHEPTQACTPPSSPPAFPWSLQRRRDAQQVSFGSTQSKSTENVFSVLGKRKPLAATSDNIRPRKQQKPVDAKPHTQMQMSLGQRIQTKCKQCGMEYVASSAEDRKLHEKFHKQSTEGCDVGKNFVSRTHRSQLFKGIQAGDAIVELDCYDHGHRRNRGQAALEVVQRELGAVPIPKKEVWAVRMQPPEGNSRYRSYLYIRETKCIGFLLVEYIQDAYQVVRPDTIASKVTDCQASTSNTPKNALEALRARKKSLERAQEAARQELEDAAKHPIQLSKLKHPAVLGVSRIWTSSTHRGQGIATCLLNAAMERCNTWVELDGEAIRRASEETKTTISDDTKAKISKMSQVERKEQVAFSQPTDSGAKLARKWFGKAYGWSVYVD